MHHGDLGDVLQRQRPVHGGVTTAGDHHPLAAKILAAADVVLHRAAGLVGGATLLAPETARAQTPKRGGTFRLALQSDPVTGFDPHQTISFVTMVPLSFAYSRLVKVKAGPSVKPGTYPIEPDLAESWTQPTDTTYVFKLKKGVRWHPKPPVNGRELTAADIKWTYEYWARSGQFKDKNLPTAQYGWFFEGMRSIETPDPYTVVVRFEQPFVPFINYTASYWNPIVPHEIYDQDGNLKSRMIGTGPRPVGRLGTVEMGDQRA